MPRRRTHTQCPLQRHERRLQYENITAKRCSDCETSSLFVRPRAPAFLLPLLPPSPFLVPRRFYAGVVPLRPIKPQTFTPLRKKLPKNLRNKRKIHNFAPTTICTNVLLKEKKKPRSYTAKALAEQLHALL